MVYGAILAGGIGKRVEGYSIPKQFIKIGDVPILVLTVRAFLRNEKIDWIYIAIHKDWDSYLQELLVRNFSGDEIKRIIVVSGGSERIHSFTNIMDNIIEMYGLNEDDVLICHDSVRPFVSQKMISDCVDATLEDGLALTVVPTIDTIHVSHEDKFIDGTLDRNGLFNGQTPSGFNIKLLKEAIDKFSEQEKNKVTGTTQLMLQLGHKLRIVEGHTSNFKITTDNDLDIADRMVRSRAKTRSITLLDCTLRDGGIVVDFAFGDERINKIKSTLEASGIEYIECGYINEKRGEPKGLTCFDSEVSIAKTVLSTGKKKDVNYVAMIDFGTYDVNKLESRNELGIDGIRLAFHKEKWREAVECGKIIMEKGYDLYIQPMVTMRYTDDEYRNLIDVCNTELKGAKGFYIVDSFGQMDSLSLLHFLEIADQYVNIDMKLGLHAHNNRQMAYSNAQTFVEYNAKHDVMLDASIMGMGKGAGNLCTELITDNLVKEGKVYNSTVLYDSISEYFSEQQKLTPWGYSLDYYLSSLYSVTPSYINIFKKDERVTTDILVELISAIPIDKKAACDRKFAEDYIKNYFEEK